MKRYITYDIDTENNEYDDLYEFLEEYDAEKITESTYLIETIVDFDKFCKDLKAVTDHGDTVVVIYSTKTNIAHKEIR